MSRKVIMIRKELPIVHSRRSPQCPGSLQYGCQCSCCHLITGAVSSSHDDKHFTAFCKGWRERVIPTVGSLSLASCLTAHGLPTDTCLQVLPAHIS